MDVTACFDQQDAEAFFRRKLSALPAFATAQHLSFELTPPEAADAARTFNAVVASVEQGASDGCTFDIEVSSASARINVRHPPADDSGTTPTYENVALTAFPEGGRFNHVEMRLTADPSGVRVVIQVQKVPALNHVFSCAKLSSTPSLRLGLMPPGGAMGGQKNIAFFDNVLFDAK